jgi:hypothetical protein
LPVHAAAFASHEVGHVDRFLDVAARLRDHFAHLTRHVAGQRLFTLLDQAGGAEQDLRPPGRRHQTPRLIRTTRGVDGAPNILNRGLLELANQLVGVGWITVLEDAPGKRRQPNAIY